MSRLGRVRGYGLGLLALAVALSTTGYFLAGQILNRPPKGMPLTPKAVARITSPGGTLELPVYRLINPRGVALPRQSPQTDRGILYSFVQARDGDWTGLGLSTPVSVAFLDSRGKVLTILDIEPCPVPSQGRGCPSYVPGVVYRQVLEVKQGWFAQNRIGSGAIVRVRPLEAVP
ncbi:DUF192 domain-containing protein [Meiothermus cerbereus]|uniref:DUF192 domain-containing protein n=1 Tax=Meiothermus cerbereus TaxID=65552 RepID=UPI003EEC061E